MTTLPDSRIPIITEKEVVKIENQHIANTNIITISSIINRC